MCLTCEIQELMFDYFFHSTSNNNCTHSQISLNKTTKNVNSKLLNSLLYKTELLSEVELFIISRNTSINQYHSLFIKLKIFMFNEHHVIIEVSFVFQQLIASSESVFLEDVEERRQQKLRFTKNMLHIGVAALF